MPLMMVIRKMQQNATDDGDKPNCHATDDGDKPKCH